MQWISGLAETARAYFAATFSLRLHLSPPAGVTVSFTFGVYFFAERSKTCWSPTVNSEMFRSSLVRGLSEHADKQCGVPSSSRTVRQRMRETTNAAREKAEETRVPYNTPRPSAPLIFSKQRFAAEARRPRVQAVQPPVLSQRLFWLSTLSCVPWFCVPAGAISPAWSRIG